MRLGVVGSRSWADRALFWKHLCSWLRRHQDLHVVSGGAKNGADALAEAWCRQKGVPITIYYAKWDKGDGTKDLGAGMARNSDIVKDCDMLLAFWDGKSRGTVDTCRKAVKAGKEVWVLSPTGEVQDGHILFETIP